MVELASLFMAEIIKWVFPELASVIVLLVTSCFTMIGKKLKPELEINYSGRSSGGANLLFFQFFPKKTAWKILMIGPRRGHGPGTPFDLNGKVYLSDQKYFDVSTLKYLSEKLGIFPAHIKCLNQMLLWHIHVVNFHDWRINYCFAHWDKFITGQ